MEPILKKALWIGGGALVISSIMGFQKFNKVKAIFDAMEIVPDAISKINVSLQLLRFNLNVKLINNSADDLFVSGASVAQLKKIDIYFKNVYLATANVSLTEVAIPGRNSLVIKNIPVEVSTGTALANASSFFNPKLSDFQIVGIVEAMGSTYEVGA